MPDVSKLRLDDVAYDIKDDNARKYLVVVNNTSQDATKVNITTSEDTVELALQSDLDSAINNISYLNGKHIVAYGDSSGTYANNYLQRLISVYGLDITNRCIGGTTMTNNNSSGESGLTRITAATDLDDFDICLVIYGINDWQTTSYIDAFRNAYDSVCKVFSNSTCEPIFIFPWFCYLSRNWSDYGWTMENCSLHGLDLPAYIDNAISVVEHYGYKYINLYKIAGVNSENYSQWLVNNGGVYVHSSEALSDKVCRILLSNIYCNGKVADFDGRNYGGMLYNNITYSNHATASNYSYNGTYGIFFQANTTPNPIQINIVDDANTGDTAVNRWHIRGTVRSSITYTRTTIKIGSDVQKYLVVPGTASFDVTLSGKGNLSIIMEFPSGSASTAVAEIYNLEVYCDRPCRPYFAQMTMLNNTTSATYASVHVDDGAIKLSPVDLTIGANLSKGQGFMQSPIVLNGIGTVSAIHSRSGTVSIVTVYNLRGFICCDIPLQTGDRLSFHFPDVPSLPQFTQHA